jgi:molecular chaperone DnaK (HSP70)
MTSPDNTTDPSSSSASGVWIGIDFGTSNSACAVWDSTRGSPKWIRLPQIALPEGSGKVGRMVPSVVRIHENSNSSGYRSKSHGFLVGEQAILQQDESITPETRNTGMLISSIKRLFGKRFGDLDPQLLESLPFHVESDENDEESLQLVIPTVDPSNDCVVVVKTTPLEIVSAILKAIKDAAQQYIDKYKIKKHFLFPGEGPIRNVVVGVPAHFSKRHTSLVEQACRLAGFEGHVSTCLESTAAAMAYGLTMQDTTKNANIMVIDMGGGTTDITIATKQSPNYEEARTHSSYKVLVTQGDEHLGGDDIDQALMEYCLKQVTPNTYTADDGMGRAQWIRACQMAKEALCDAGSPSASETISVDKINVSISQEQFQLLLKGWLKKAEHLIQRALDEFQKITTSGVSEVILVGGTTRVPAIRALIQSKFPTLELCTSLNPMSSVAQGLAIQAALQSKLIPIHELKSALMLDCVPHAIGVALSNGEFCPVIPRNAPLPARGSATFTLADMEQKGVTIRAVEQIEVNGSNDTTIQYEPMAKEDFTFLLRRLSKKEMDEMENRTIEVGMKVDAEGQFMVSIFDEKDPEQVRKRERFQKLSDDKNAVGELSYITDLVLAESGSSMEQFLLFGTFIGLFVLYIAVKMAFNDPILVQEEEVLL